MHKQHAKSDTMYCLSDLYVTCIEFGTLPNKQLICMPTQNFIVAQRWINAVADPGLQIGGVHLVGGADSQGSYASKILYVNAKESRTLGGVHWRRLLDPPMQ